MTLRTELPDPVDPYALMGAPKLAQTYDTWAKVHEASGGDRNVVLGLGYHKALSAEFTPGSGAVKVDLLSGHVEAAVQDLPPAEYELWLIDNRPGEDRSVAPEPSDRRVRVGRFVPDGERATIEAELGAPLFRSFHVDLAVVTRADVGPERGLLFGTPDLFQRIYTALRSPLLLASSDFGGASPDAIFQIGTALAQDSAIVDVVSGGDGTVTAPNGAIRTPTGGVITDGGTTNGAVTDSSTARNGGSGDVLAQIAVDRDVLFNALVQRGANLFIRETFRGNGRTCATCHPLARNTQLNVSDIASLPDSDPLFVAEFSPALLFTANGPKFEVPVLMRGAALITENVDGFGDLANRFTLRGIPHTLALTTSLRPSNDASQALPNPPLQRTGWSGDGAPPPGALRNFATGAVTQHFTRSFARMPGVDFRLPTEAELDAMEAFQLSLGRTRDPELPLPFKGTIVARGQTVFMSAGARCNTCHHNASANALIAGTMGVGPVVPNGDPNADANQNNRNFGTGVEIRVVNAGQPNEIVIDLPVQVILEQAGLDITPGAAGLFPADGGFGDAPNFLPDGLVAGTTPVLGNNSFNTPPLVEAADTGPFFHNNQIRTIEGAVAFYNGPGFNSTRAANAQINLPPPQVEEIAAFLRALNAVENIRAARELADTVRTLRPIDRARVGPALLRQAASEVLDGINVLSGADLHPRAVSRLRSALQSIGSNGSGTGNAATIVQLLDQARADIL